MGADMLIYICPALIDEHGNTPRADQREQVAAALWDRVRALDTRPLSDALEAAGVYDVGTDPRDPELVAAVDGFIETLIDASLENRRDARCVRFGAREYVLSGGMSWGDTPADACNAILFADYSGIADEPVRLGSSPLSQHVVRWETVITAPDETAAAKLAAHHLPHPTVG